jgi:hypothetical protein
MPLFIGECSKGKAKHCMPLFIRECSKDATFYKGMQ